MVEKVQECQTWVECINKNKNVNLNIGLRFLLIFTIKNDRMVQGDVNEYNSIFNKTFY